MKESVRIYRSLVDTRLIIRQRIYLLVICILLAMDFGNVINKNIGATLATEGLLISTIVGVFLSTVFKIVWHEEKAKIVSKLDTFGIIIFALYIGFELARNQILGQFLSGSKLASFSLIVVTGLILGRYLGTYIKIKEVLASDQVPPIDDVDTGMKK